MPETFDFGEALHRMRTGQKVARVGWNGKGIFIALKPGFDLEAAAAKAHDEWMESKRRQGIASRISDWGEEFMVSYAQLSERAKDLDRGMFRNQVEMTAPYFYIDTTGLQTDNPAAPKVRVPWFASQTDMQAEDWMIVQ